MPRRFDQLLRGPHLRLPRPLDAVGDHWAGLRPRVRMILVLLLAVGLLLALDARVRAVDARWGGAAQWVLVATEHLPVGTPPANRVRRVRLPPAAVPPHALTELEQPVRLALAVAEGTVLTAAHVDARGPAAGLADGMRAVPVPADPGWGVVAGGWVDVWVLGAGDEPAVLVARARPVIEVRDDPAGLTSLIGLAGSEVEAVTSGLAVGKVLLAHAPRP